MGEAERIGRCPNCGQIVEFKIISQGEGEEKKETKNFNFQNQSLRPNSESELDFLYYCPT